MDKTLFRALAETYRSMVYRVALNFFRNIDDAEDAAQEAYLRLYANLYRSPDERSATAFLYRTAYRLSIDILRSRRRFREIEASAPQNDNLSDRMYSALMKLKPIDRSVIYLRVVEESGYDEIAARFGKTEAWARKRYSLARRRLETAYSEQNPNL